MTAEDILDKLKNKVSDWKEFRAEHPEANPDTYINNLDEWVKDIEREAK